MKPMFAVVQRNFYNTYDVKQQRLLTEIGWGDLVGKPEWKDTCAIRMSLALIKSGVTIPGRMRIKAGPHKGKLIEPGQANLSRMLRASHMLGEPELYRSHDFETKVGHRAGIVSFFRIDPTAPGPGQGHIDLVSLKQKMAMCESFCYWEAREMWFWPLS